MKGPSSGAFQSPAAENLPGGIAASEHPCAEYGEGSVASSRHAKSPEIPEHGFQKRIPEGSWGFDISVRVLLPGTWCPHHPLGLVVIELELHQNAYFKSNGTRDKGQQRLVDIKTSSGDLLNAWSFVH